MAEREYSPSHFLEEVPLPHTVDDDVIPEIKPTHPVISIEQGLTLANQASLGSIKRIIAERGGPLISMDLVIDFSDSLDALRAGGYTLEVVPPTDPAKAKKNLEKRIEAWDTMENILASEEYEEVKKSQPQLIQQLLEYYNKVREVDRNLFQLTRPK